MRIGKPKPEPFAVRRDGSLVDRETGTKFGSVYNDLVRDRWTSVADNTNGEFHGSRRVDSARRAWYAWQENLT